LIICERLEAEGWPRQSSPKRLAEDKIRRCREQVAIVRGAAQELVFYPQLLRDDIGIVEQHELEEAEKELCRLADQLSQHGSFQEAEEQLRRASFDGAITAIANLYKPGCPVQDSVEVPGAAFDRMVNVHYSTDRIVALWGDIYRNVRYRAADLDQIWRPQRAPKRPEDQEVAAWMERYAASEQAAGRPKVKKQDAIDKCIKATNARKRQSEAAYRALPEHRRYLVGNKKINR
jgi:hypothetical protein